MYIIIAKIVHLVYFIFPPQMTNNPRSFEELIQYFTTLQAEMEETRRLLEVPIAIQPNPLFFNPLFPHAPRLGRDLSHRLFYPPPPISRTITPGQYRRLATDSFEIPDYRLPNNLLSEEPEFSAEELGCIFQVNKLTTLETKSNCSICLDPVKRPTKKNTIVKLKCSDLFHSYCIVEWLRQSPTCPNCRKSIEVEIE